MSFEVVEHHHHVLAAWAKLRAALPHPPHLLTFDFHTDTLPAFNRYAYKLLALESKRHSFSEEELLAKRKPLLAALDFRTPQSIEAGLRWLRHDEHIDAAKEAGIVDQIAVILSTSEPGNRRDIAEVFPALLPESQLDEAPALQAQAASLLETTRLTPIVNALEKSWGRSLTECDYIADIDLDFFRSNAAIAPKDPSLFQHILKHAALVTVARESQCVREGRLPGESITADTLLTRLTMHLSWI